MLKIRNNIVTPPGSTLNDLLIEKNISIEVFAKKVSLYPSIIQKIIDGEVVISKDTARRFEKVLNVPAEFWIERDRLYWESKQK